MNIVLKTLTASTVLLLAACGQNIPDPSGKYEKPVEKDSGFFYSYEISPFDKENKGKYKFTEIKIPKEGETKIVLDHIYVFIEGSEGKFCSEGWKEMGIADCFEYDPKKGIRLNNRTEFFKKVE